MFWEVSEKSISLWNILWTENRRILIIQWQDNSILLSQICKDKQLLTNFAHKSKGRYCQVNTCVLSAKGCVVLLQKNTTSTETTVIAVTAWLPEFVVVYTRRHDGFWRFRQDKREWMALTTWVRRSSFENYWLRTPIAYLNQKKGLLW